MAFRHQDFAELCVFCKAPATAECARCIRPLCAEHAPLAATERCAVCEEQFLIGDGENVKLVGSKLSMVAYSGGLGLIGVSLILLGAGVSAYVLPFFSGVGLLGASSSAGLISHHLRRARFLRQHKRLHGPRPVGLLSD